MVATPVGGVPDLIEDGVNGFLVGDEDPAALATALVRVLAMPAALEPVAAEAHDSVRPGCSRRGNSPGASASSPV